MHPANLRILFPLAAIFAAACAERQADAGAPNSPFKEPLNMEEAVEHAEPVSDLPWSRGKSFSTLDEYLAHLRANGAIDLPWYREIRPGVYELVTSRRPPPEPEVISREELMERFGFTR